MLSDELLDVADKSACVHGPHLSRVITRMSTMNEGNHTILRCNTRTPIMWDMAAPTINMEKLKADMARRVEAASARKFSLEVTGGKNPDFYRNFVNNGQDKRLTAELFLGIVAALHAAPEDYTIGGETWQRLPSEPVLTATFAIMLGALGVDPNEDGRAHKLAARFPDTLRQIEALHADAVSSIDVSLPEYASVLAEGRQAS